MPTWKCPQCGEENRDTALMCGLCGERRPEEKPQEIVARALGPVPPPPAPPSRPSSVPAEIASRGEAPAGWKPSEGGQNWDPHGSRYLSPDEKRRLAEEAAARILGPTTKATASQTGCGTMAIFVALLPWSLILLPMPGGLKNKNALKFLAVIAVGLLIVSLLSAAVFLPSLLGKVQSIGNAYKDAANQ